MNLLLSIRPHYAIKYLVGSKLYEYRKTIPSFNIDKVYIYATSPIKRVVGEFSIDGVICDAPSKVWEQTHKESGISEQDFCNYFKGMTRAYAIRIKYVVRYDQPVILSIRPPQNFMYIDKLESVTSIT